MVHVKETCTPEILDTYEFHLGIYGLDICKENGIFGLMLPLIYIKQVRVTGAVQRFSFQCLDELQPKCEHLHSPKIVDFFHGLSSNSTKSKI